MSSTIEQSTNNARHNIIVGCGALGLGLYGLFNLDSEQTTSGPRLSNTKLLKFENKIYPDKLKISGSYELSLNELLYATIEDLSCNDSARNFWLCIPAYAVREVMETLAPYFTNEDVIILCSNGLGVYVDAASIIGRKVKLLRGLVEFGLRRNSIENVFISGKAKALFSFPIEYAEYGTALCTSLIDKGWQVSTSNNVAQAEWEKVLYNIFINPLCALAQVKNKEAGGSLKTLALQLVLEARLVAKAEGFNLDFLTDDILINKIQFSAENICSTLAQLRNKKRTEIDFILGRVIKLGIFYKIKTPLLDIVHALLQIREKQTVSDGI